MDKKQIGHVVVLGTALVLNLSATNYASAATACTVGTGSTIASSAAGFVKNDFVPRCSANTTVNYAQSGTDFAVQAASAKGAHTYGGSTVGGAVAACQTSSVSNPVGALSGSPPTTSPAAGTPAGC